VANLVEVRWHGRGGQGAKTAALLLAEAAIAEGKYGQAFPEYGPERTGHPFEASPESLMNQFGFIAPFRIRMW